MNPIKTPGEIWFCYMLMSEREGERKAAHFRLCVRNEDGHGWVSNPAGKTQNEIRSIRLSGQKTPPCVSKSASLRNIIRSRTSTWPLRRPFPFCVFGDRAFGWSDLKKWIRNPKAGRQNDICVVRRHSLNLVLPQLLSEIRRGIWLFSLQSQALRLLLSHLCE